MRLNGVIGLERTSRGPSFPVDPLSDGEESPCPQAWTVFYFCIPVKIPVHQAPAVHGKPEPEDCQSPLAVTEQ